MNAANMELGSNVSIHPMCYLDASGGIRIGNDVSIAHGTSILSFEHRFDSLEIPIKDQEVDYRPVSIGNDVWIGAKATIVAGKTIGTGSIIGANSVVTHDVDTYVIVAGSPAREIKKRQ